MSKIHTILCHAFILMLVLTACNPEAHWETNDVTLEISVKTISAGYVECNFSTNKDAYYMVAIEPARDGYDPMEHQKQFMTLALDSANVDYLAWRNQLLKEGEFNIAPFASHALQYGSVNHFFTGLYPDTDYWIYAFIVDPDKLEPASKLYLERITSTAESKIDVHFDYRVKGRWDYIYPLDSTGRINARFPYIATTRDSLELTGNEDSIRSFFMGWLLEQFVETNSAQVYYGVKAIENDGWQSHNDFEEGHTYYTCIGGYDGLWKQMALYKFVWHDSINLYLQDIYPNNLMRTEDGWWWLSE